jgi:hypothetical protein
LAAADPDDLASDATREALRLLNALRLSIIGSISSAPEPLSGALFGLLREIDEQILTFQRELTGAMGRHVETAAAAGDEAVLDDLRAGGLQPPLSYMGVDPVLVRTAADYVADLVTGLASDARQRISREIRLAALGGMSTTELIDRIGRNLTDPSVFGTIATRAEMIARTEVSRVRSMAFADQSLEAAQRFPGLRKVWEHSSSSPGFTTFQARQSRPNHVRLWSETSANPIPVDAPFDLGNGITAMYPHDPVLPAKEVVACRCRMRLVAPEPEEV